jgi:hypothetical protein
MADDKGPLSWLFSVVDKMSRPLRDIEKAMGAMGKEAKEAEGHVGAFEKQIEKLEGQIKAIKSDPAGFKHMQKMNQELREIQETGGTKWGKFRHNLFETLEIAKSIGEAFHWVGEKVYEFGSEVVKAAANEEKLGLQFELVMGNKDEARELAERIEQVGKASYMSTDALKQMELVLLRAGYRGEQLSQIQAAAQDIGALKGATPEAAMGAAQTLAKLRLRGGIRRATQLQEIAEETGITQPEIEAAIAKQFGVKVDRVKELISAGRVDSERALQVIYDALVKRGGGTGLGALAERAGKTLDARLTKLKEAPEKLFEKWAESPGFQKFSDAIQNLIDKLDPDSDTGKRLVAAIQTVADQIADIFAKLTKDDTLDKLVKAFTEIIPLATKLAEIFASLVGGAKALVDMYGLTKEAEAAGGQEAWQQKQLDLLKNAPKSNTGVWDAVSSIWRDWNVTPEEAMARAKAGRAPESAAASTSENPAIALAKRGLGAVMGGPITIGGGINVTVHGSDHGNPEEQGRNIAQTIQRELTRLLESMAVQQGVH